MTLITILSLALSGLLRPHIDSSEQWCTLSCKIGDSFENNTMCQYNELEGTPECGGIANSLGSLQAVALLEAHNKYRNNLAGGDGDWPPAANMRFLRWDAELAQVAQRWATQCQGIKHDKCRKTSKFEYVGQNIFTFSAPIGTVPGFSKDYLHLWTNKINLTSAENINDYRPSPDQDTSADEFTQLIWAETFKMGCGEILYNSEERVHVLLVCNYGTAGNVIGQPIYKTGEPCSQCPYGTKCYKNSKYPNLCATAMDYYFPYDDIPI